MEEEEGEIGQWVLGRYLRMGSIYASMNNTEGRELLFLFSHQILLQILIQVNPIMIVSHEKDCVLVLSCKPTHPAPCFWDIICY